MRSLVTKLALIIVLVFAFQALTGTFAMAAQAQTQKLDPMMAALASFILPGLGQYLLGDQPKAINHLLIAIGLGIVGFLLSPYTFGLTSFLPLLWSIYSAYDAYQMAK
ncbi:MAG: hypothetical protein N2380_02700 [bacterium]|nr:hypothetical protein [bacterium]